MSQFAFLQAEFSEVFGYAARAETLVHGDPRGAAFYGRLALETAVTWLYRHDGTLKNPYETTLAARLAEPTFQALVGRTLWSKARFVKLIFDSWRGLAVRKLLILLVRGADISNM